jgi:preprotein translocase subunit SecG
MNFLLGFLTLALILTSLFLVLVVLMQKTKDGGMGAALGGGATESAFGHETGNVLSKATINAAIAFFVLNFALYLGRIYEHKHASATDGLLERASMPAAKPITPSPAATPPAAVSFAPVTSPAPATAASTGVPAADTAKPADAPKPATP